MEGMTLKHYAHEPVMRLDRTWDYTPRSVRHDKPRGLWVSVQGPDDWEDWCRREEYCTDRLVNEHDVTLSWGAELLTIGTLADLEDLAYRYPGDDRWSGRFPDWGMVAAEYDGIVIAPYQWGARMDLDLSWYYTWDCASGCIWNLGAVESLTPTNLGART